MIPENIVLMRLGAGHCGHKSMRCITAVKPLAVNPTNKNP